MNKEESMLQKRLVELSRLAYNRGIVIFSDFLNLNELNILHTTPKDMFLSQYKTYGGYDLSERQMAVFLPDALYYDYEYPIQIIEVTPSSKRFAEDLTHRDYLGALMNLGIERSKVGDIIVEDQKGLIFVKEELAEYIADNLTVVRHTNVNTSIGKGVKVDYEPRFEELKGTVSSIRLDSVLALAYPLSRSKITAQIEAGKVFVNGKLITSNGYRLKDNDIISVRKMGRIAYDGILSETKKGRYLISVRKYIYTVNFYRRSIMKTNTKRITHYIMALVSIVVLVLLDQITKHLVVLHLKDRSAYVLIKDVFQLEYLENRGAAFGVLQNQRIFFYISVLLITIAVIWFYHKVPIEHKYLPLRICAVLILSGAFGNCIDRIRLNYVVDFLYFKLINFPIFNVADIYVTVAAFLLVILILIYYKEDDLERIFH